TSWTDAHVLALAGGALLTYAWHSFPQEPVLGSKGTVDLVGNAVFSTGAVLLLAAAVRRVRRGVGPACRRPPRTRPGPCGAPPRGRDRRRCRRHPATGRAGGGRRTPRARTGGPLSTAPR